MALRNLLPTRDTRKGEATPERPPFRRRLAAAFVYLAFYYALTLPLIAWGDHILAEHLGRMWLLCIVLTMTPFSRHFPFLQGLVLSFIPVAVSFFQMWLTYEYRGWESQGDIHDGAVVGVMAYAIGVAATGSWLAKKVTGARFSMF